MADDLLDDLTPEQRVAVTHFEGPMLVLAGPGSGKTRVITRRVAWLLRQGVRPWNILAITFTNKAASVMRERIEAIVPGNRVLVSTFHALGARLLRQYGERIGLDRNFTIYDMTDRNNLIKDVLESMEDQFGNARVSPDRVGGLISMAKNQLLTPEQLLEKSNKFDEQVAARVYASYQRRMLHAKALDFDDLLYWPATALRKHDDLRAELDERFRFILIDEYQDTNSAQYHIARALSRDYRNLCAVGDVDQSIYGWRGADIRNILDFERDYPDVKIVRLEKNYRSTGHILRAADALIRHNTQRKAKALVTDKPDGQPVRVCTFPDGLTEAENVARRIKQAVQDGSCQYREIALFLRMNALSRTIESAFLHHGVPYQIVRGLAFFDRKENKDVLAYLRLLCNPADEMSFLRIVNEPPRGIGKTTLGHLAHYARLRGLGLLQAAEQIDRIPAIKGKPGKALLDFARLMANLREHIHLPPDELIRLVLERTGYRAIFDQKNEEDLDRLANVEELITAARQFTEAFPASEGQSATIRDWLESVTLASDQDAYDEKKDAVSVMTLHAAKGLEFPVVYILAVEQGILPHERSLSRPNSTELEEERRLFFVGMTRAERELNICHAKNREFRGQLLTAIPSMFLNELPPADVEFVGTPQRSAADRYRAEVDLEESGWVQTKAAKPAVKPLPPDKHGFAVGVTVEHARYGRGQITEITGFGALRRLRVRFASAGDMTLMAEQAPLKVVG